jgi:hypothetical protein
MEAKKTAVKRHLYINVMVQMRARNVNVGAVTFVVFPLGGPCASGKFAQLRAMLAFVAFS